MAKTELTEEQYSQWLKGFQEAETSMQGREEKVEPTYTYIYILEVCIYVPVRSIPGMHIPEEYNLSLSFHTISRACFVWAQA